MFSLYGNGVKPVVNGITLPLEGQFCTMRFVTFRPSGVVECAREKQPLCYKSVWYRLASRSFVK